MMTTSSSSSELLRPYIDRSLIPDPLIVRIGRPVTLSLLVRANPTPSVSWYIGPRLVSANQDDKYQTTVEPGAEQPPSAVQASAAAAAAAIDADGVDPDRFLHRFGLRILKASRELDRGIFVVASNVSGDDCSFVGVRTYEVFEGRSKSYIDLLPSNETKEGERKLLKFYRKISFGSLEDQIRRTRMMEERNRMRCFDDQLNPGASSTESSPGGISSHDLSDSSAAEGKRSQRHQSQPPRADFDTTEVIFENVCLPSPLLSYRSTPSGRRKTLPSASPLTSHRSPPWDRPLKNNTETAALQHRFVVSPGNGNCRGEEPPMADIHAKCRGMMDASSGEHFVESVARGATVSVVNHDAVASCGIGRLRTHANGSDENGGGGGDGVILTSIDSWSDAKAQTNANATAGDANAAGHLSPTESRRRSSSEYPKRLLLVTDLDSLEADPPHAHATASIDVLHSSHSHRSHRSHIRSSSVDHPVPLSSSPATAADVVWEWSGRKLSNVCQTLITDCGRFAGKATESPDDASAAPAADTSSAGGGAVNQTRHTYRHQTRDDEHRFPEFHRGNSEPSTRSNSSLFADSGLASGGRRIGRSNDVESRSVDTKIASPHSSSWLDADQHRLDGGIDAFTVDLTRQSSEFSFGIQSIPSSPLRFAPRGNALSSVVAPSANDALTKKISEATNTQHAGKLRLETAIDSDEGSNEEESSSPGDELKGVGRREESNGVASRSTGRRGRTLERGKYDSPSLLKDFIKPELKKFSLPPASKDLDLDTELAIWELSDFAPDRHQSAPPKDTTMQVAKSDDLLLRSRQTSVSPLRTRISGLGSSPRWIRGTKSVEILTSRNASPGGAKIRRRTLSKEWQIFTLTTREEITTTTRPKSVSHGDHTREQTSEEKFCESELSLGNITFHGNSLETSNLQVLSDGDQIGFGASSVSSTDAICVEERNIEEGSSQRATWNAETKDHSRVETEIKNPSPDWTDSALKLSIDESDSGISSQTLSAATNDRQQTNGHILHTGYEDRTQANDELHVVRSNTVSAAQTELAETASTFSPSAPPPQKTGVDGKCLTVSDELSLALSSSSGPFSQPEQLVLDNSSSSSSAQNSDEVAFWTIISEALAEMMKEVQLAEGANSTGDDTTSMTNNESTMSNGTNETDTPASVPFSDAGESLRIVEASDVAENIFIPDSLGNCETPDPYGADIDALVQALLYFANEGAILESVTMSGAQAALVNTQPPLNKESMHEDVTTTNDNLPLSSSNWPQDSVKETTNATLSTLNLAGSNEAICSEGSAPTRTATWDLLDRSEEAKYTNSAEFHPKPSDNTLEVFDDDFPVENFDAESVLEIREESDELDSSEQVELHSSPSASLAGDGVTPDGRSQSDSVSKENSACSSDDKVRRRTVSKQDGAPEVTSRRHGSDSGDVFAEKAFLESLFSSLGTIIFLLLAALIFHVLSRIVEHEL